MAKRPLGWARWPTLACFAASVALIVAAFPVDALMGVMQGWIHGLGFWAPLAFSVVYGLAATLFVPGSVLSLAAGVVFGVWQGTAVVWCGAVLAIVLSFLIARYGARRRVEALARRRPRFGAVDRALGEQGWKIVALMRLSPLFPFNVQNYLFGVTAIRFWPYCLASAIFIIPGTFLYVYLGYAGGETAMAVGGSDSVDALKLGLQLAGLVATLAVTVLVARVAAKAIAMHAPAEPNRTESMRPRGKKAAYRRIATLPLAAACLVASMAAFALRDSIRAVFMPPKVELVERFVDHVGSATFDHAALDAVLGAWVDEGGLVDYEALAAQPSALDSYIAAVASAPWSALGRDEKLALLINAYNAFTLKLIAERYPLDSIHSIPENERWKASRWRVAGGVYSLDEIETSLIRGSFREDRVHFALVCAAIGCPKLRREAYTGAGLDDQLDLQASEIHRSERWFRFDEENGLVWLTQVYSWYSEDFEQMHGSVLDAASRYSSQLQQALAENRPLRVRWLPYDWALNDRRSHGSVDGPGSD